MQSTDALIRNWRDARHNAPFYPTMTFLFHEAHENQPLADVGCAYCVDDRIVFRGSEVDCLWCLDAPARRLSKIPVPFSTTCIDVLWGDARRACAIFDNRPVQPQDPGLPTFELAVFDLRSGEASKRDFEPIEKALNEAGFAAETIRFSQSARGRIIVADGTKAALLDIAQ